MAVKCSDLLRGAIRPVSQNHDLRGYVEDGITLGEGKLDAAREHCRRGLELDAYIGRVERYLERLEVDTGERDFSHLHAEPEFDVTKNVIASIPLLMRH